MAKMKTADKTN